MIRTIRKGLAHLPDCVALFKQLALEKIITYAGIKERFYLAEEMAMISVLKAPAKAKGTAKVGIFEGGRGAC